MRRLIVLLLVAAFVVFVASTAEAVVKSKPGSNYDRQSGTCEFVAQFGDLIVTCDPGEQHFFRYDFAIPRDARRVRAVVIGHCEGDGQAVFDWDRRPRRRVKVSVYVDASDATVIFECSLGPVKVRYRR